MEVLSEPSSASRYTSIQPESDREPEVESDGIGDEMQGVNQLLADFAALANARVRPQPLVRIGGRDRGWLRPGSTERARTPSVIVLVPGRCLVQRHAAKLDLDDLEQPAPLGLIAKRMRAADVIVHVGPL
jgi:hypothetical protein